jgi:glucokinase
MPVRVVNDARAAGYAEARRAIVPDSRTGGGTVLVVTVGTGIGGAVVVGGRLLEGSGHAGEIGHMSIDPHGRQCDCGRRGCWERLVGGRALRESLGDRWASVGDLAACAERGDENAVAHIAARAEAFGAGLDSLCAVLAPTTVVLGGGIIARGGPIAAAYTAAARDLRWLRGRLQLSRLGDHAGLMGAGLLAWELAEGRGV